MPFGHLSERYINVEIPNPNLFDSSRIDFGESCVNDANL